MNKSELQALLSANNVAFATTDNVAELRQLVKDNGLSETSTTDSDTTTVVKLRPAPSPAIVNNVDRVVTGADMVNIRWKYHRPYTTESAKERHPDGFNAYLYKKGNVEIPFISDDQSFIKNFAENEIHSVTLTSVVTGVQLPATAWDEAKPEVLYELNTIITKKDRAYFRNDAFQDFVFNPATFQSNPELLSKSGMLDKIMDATV